MAAFIVFFLLFILPFIILPFGVTQFENPKVILAESAVILLFFVHLFTNSLQFKPKRSFLIIYAALFLLALLDIFFFKTDINFFGNAFRMQGIFLLLLLLIFSLLSSRITFKITYVWFFILLLTETILMFFLPLNESGRYVGTLGEPNALAAFAVFAWPFVFFGIKKFGNKEKVITALSAVLVGIILFLSGSHSGIIAFGIEIAFIFLQKMKLPLTKTLAICLFIYAISYALPFFQNIPYENRTEIWRAAISAGSTSPVFGNGFGNAETAIHNAARHIDLPIQYYYVDSAHNIFLDYWVEGGIIGVGAIITLIILAFKTFIKDKNARNITLFLGLITALSFNPASVVGLLGFWYIAGQASESKKQPQSNLI